jgi:hypothetical protein
MAFFIVLILLLLSVSLNDATSAEPTSMPSQLTANVALAPSATVDLISAANSLSKAAVEEVLKASNVAALNIANATFTAVASSIAKGSVEVAELILDKTMTKVDQKSGADGMTYLMMAGQRFQRYSNDCDVVAWCGSIQRLKTGEERRGLRMRSSIPSHKKK